MNYKNHIGDGKIPNRYWVFHYDEKFRKVKHEDFTELEVIKESSENGNSLIGEFKTFAEALTCVDNKAYYPHVIIEDRLSGLVFESLAIVCECCGKEDYESSRDTGFTEKKLQEAGIEFK